MQQHTGPLAKGCEILIRGGPADGKCTACYEKTVLTIVVIRVEPQFGSAIASLVFFRVLGSPFVTRWNGLVASHQRVPADDDSLL